MKNKKTFYIIAILLLTALLSWWFGGFRKSQKGGALTNSASRASIQLSTPNKAINLPLVSVTPAADQSTSALANDAALQALAPSMIRAGQERAQEQKEFLDNENKKSLNLYGKVVDQYGSPIVGAKILGSVLLNDGLENTRGKQYTTVTDAQGKFEFIGLHGLELGIQPQKDGYYYDSRLSASRPDNYYMADPNNLVIFTMWKLKGAEPVEHSKFGGWIPYDGTQVNIDLFTGKQSDIGELKVTLSRNPLQVVRGKTHFDWNVRIEIAGGGLVEEHELYPYQAPTDGYLTYFEFSEKNEDPHWTQKLVKDFYIMTSQGRYGRIHVDLTTDSDRPEGTGLGIDIYINPSGSHNLEYELDDQFKPQ